MSRLIDTQLDGAGDLVFSIADREVARLDPSLNITTKGSVNGGSQSAFGIKRWFSPADYGAIGDNVPGHDDGPAIRAANAAAAAAKGSLYLEPPPVAYRLETAVQISHDYAEWLQSLHTKVVCAIADPTIVPLKFGNDAGPMAGLNVPTLVLERGAAAHRQPLVQFGSAQALTDFNVEDVHLLGQNNWAGDGMLLHSVFNGRLAGVNILNIVGIGAAYRSAVQCGNVHFDSWVHNSCQIMFLLQENYTGSPQTLINSLKFTNTKSAPGVGSYGNQKFFAATVAVAGAVSGSTVIPLGAGQVAGGPIVAGDWVCLYSFTGSKIFADEVLSVNSGADTITLKNPNGVPFALASGDPVIVGRWHTVAGPNTAGLEWEVPHFERCNGVMAAGSNVGEINVPMLGSGLLRGAYLLHNVHGYKLSRPTAPGGLSASGIVMHQANNGGLSSRNRLEASPLEELGSTGTMLQVDGGKAVSHVERYGGNEHLLGVYHQDTTVAINQTDVVLTGPANAARGVRMKNYGALVGIVAQLSSARTAGTLTVKVFKNSSEISPNLRAVIDGSNVLWIVVEPTAMITFIPGDYIDVRVTTDGTFAPTANNLDVSLYVAQ